MVSFENRWDAGKEYFYENHVNPISKGATRPSKVLNKLVLERAFSETTFIYGTVGPHPYSNGNNGSTDLIKGILNLNRAYGFNKSEQPQDTDPELVRRRKAARVIQKAARKFLMMTNIYDPGVRTKQYILKGHQMMDMYFGMQGQNNNKFWRHRNNIIAEFVHYVMGYHTRGVAFDPEMPGWKAYQEAFNTTDPGWQGNRYGPDQSTTKEISKIIRHGIQTFGGKLIFEAQQVYGDNIFSWNGSPRDADIEAQDLFQYVRRGTQSPQVKYGDKGTLEFQWGGEPTVLSRAHFLTNWKFSGAATHSRANQDGGNRWDWIGFVERAMDVGMHRHGLHPLWDNFRNFPINMQGLSGIDGMLNAIDRLCDA